MKFIIREMKPSDGSKVLAIFGEGIEGGNATFDRDVPSLEAWDSKFFKCCRFVAEDQNNNVAGWAAIQPVSKRDCFTGVAEVSIYISNAAQGQGLGLDLLRRLVEESEAHGYWTLQAGIFPENVASIKIHEKLGFRTVGIRQRLAQMKGVWRDVLLMERRSEIVGN